MLKKIYRLSSPRVTNSISIAGPLFSLKTARNNLDIPRFAFVLSKKLDPKATARNSVKRKLSASIEQIFDRISANRDFVFYPKPQILEVSQKEVLKEIENVFEKEGFLK